MPAFLSNVLRGKLSIEEMFNHKPSELKPVSAPLKLFKFVGVFQRRYLKLEGEEVRPEESDKLGLLVGVETHF